MGGNIIDFPKTSITCNFCPWADSCVVHDARDGSRALRCSAPTRRNQHIAHQGDRLEYLYILRSGSAKSYFDSSDGLEQIVAFHYPGDLLGFDGFAHGTHQSSIIALETAALCRIPLGAGDEALFEVPQLWRGVMRAGAEQMRDQSAHTLLLGQKSASARFASFILDVSARLAARGCSKSEFNLSMARQDIANYLSLAVETVSRLFSELQAQGILAVERRFVQILAFDRLEALAADRAGGGSRARSG